MERQLVLVTCGEPCPSHANGLVADIDNLNQQIAALQNSSGTLTPEDQASLNDLEAAGQALADRIKTVDEMTPPTPPTP